MRSEARCWFFVNTVPYPNPFETRQGTLFDPLWLRDPVARPDPQRAYASLHRAIINVRSSCCSRGLKRLTSSTSAASNACGGSSHSVAVAYGHHIRQRTMSHILGVGRRCDQCKHRATIRRCDGYPTACTRKMIVRDQTKAELLYIKYDAAVLSTHEDRRKKQTQIKAPATSRGVPGRAQKGHWGARFATR